MSLGILNSDELCAPPEVCGPDAEDSRQQHLLAQTTADNDHRVTKFLKRDKQLLRAIVAMVLLMNIPKLSYVLYPFKIFSTWIHELSHGAAAILTGGGIQKILIYPDTSGLAWTYTDGSNFRRGFVASAGYTGTAVLGMFLLLFRRTHRGPTIGTIAISVMILVSCMLYVRNTFALVFLPIMALILIICAWKLKVKYLGYLYSFLAATCSFNAIDNIHELFGPVGYVNGQEATSDAHTVAEYWGGDYKTWATLWFTFASVCSAIGLLLAFDGLTYKSQQKGTSDTLPVTVAVAAPIPVAAALAQPAGGVKTNEAPAKKPFWQNITGTPRGKTVVIY
mmetsp:Transcript_51991/g.110471  ORF Transcript_51991/g.110471 Transcript_51991/m.110471 type:complete len:336 (+) Transcript_51991:94-1101(+)|eukprot:CAMPEP_0172537426 /NCGR_PEP_ID=MMETSP1067-20121228/9026_1 /TAXON_ID=265564 ORGANISM="Thalassiosira punctigera, Strain Tpunct2005C2" /NCGR_SAMPLE_ID=MMETSP1067 /ASSEMBLY_ACC=CAM_ASM_000444 /LENGTH=335 /DNA_ID=CAMNT_0013322725 /DNA_START=74 /DNA_END=1081 /DNA_ORIENTATION=+